jgi:DNA-binding XRE family transcriptional regulator
MATEYFSSSRIFALTSAPDYSYLQYMSQRKGRPRGLTPDGPKIRRLRLERGLTAAQLAPRVPLHPKTLMAIEAANKSLSEVAASRLAKLLGVRMSDITDYDDSDSGAEKIPA